MKDRKIWGLLGIISVLVNILGTIIFTESVKVIGASVLSLIFAALPLFTLPLALLINKEKVTKFEFSGILLTILGIIIILIQFTRIQLEYKDPMFQFSIQHENGNINLMIRKKKKILGI